MIFPYPLHWIIAMALKTWQGDQKLTGPIVKQLWVIIMLKMYSAFLKLAFLKASSHHIRQRVLLKVV